MKSEKYRSWVYERLGDYHRNLNPNWSYTPTYLSKRQHVCAFIESLPRTSRILDLACGEGVFVEEFHEQGWDISGLDYNYESEYVERGDARSLPYGDSSFDVVIFLDAIEHFGFSDQSTVLKEIYRVLKPQGQLMMTAPNLAHINSRFRMMLQGKLDRTDNELEHLGERPASETRRLLSQTGFKIINEIGITFTFPFIYRQLICRYPARFRWLHDAMEPLAQIFKNLAMVNGYYCKKSYFLNGKISAESKAAVLEGSPNRDLFEINSHLTERERDLLYKLARDLAPGSTAVEIGSHLGSGTSFIAEGMRRSGGKVFAVDDWKTTGITDGDSDTWSLFKENTAPYKDWIVPLRGTPQELADTFGESIDLFIVNGNHSDETIKEILDHWLVKLKDRAVIAFNNYNKLDEVQKSVSENIIPIQCEAGRKVDSSYWTRVEPARRNTSSVYATVAIPTFKRNEMVLDALHSVKEQKFSKSFEILVMDNGSDEDLQRKLDDIAADTEIPVRYIPVQEIGLHNGRNKALLEGTGEIIVLIDDDVLTPENWLENLLKPFENDEVICVGGKTSPRWEGALPEWIESIHKSFFSLLDLGAESREMNWPETPYGCNMAVRRDWAIRVDGFAPDGMGNQLIEWKRGDGETGFARKIYDHGGKVFYSSEAFLYHRIPPSRLTRSFLYKRSMKGAISTSFSEVRKRRYSRTQLTRKSLVNLYRTMRLTARHLFRSLTGKGDITDRIMIIEFLVRSLYMGRLALDRNLRTWVLKDEYMS